MGKKIKDIQKENILYADNKNKNKKNQFKANENLLQKNKKSYFNNKFFQNIFLLAVILFLTIIAFSKFFPKVEVSAMKIACNKYKSFKEWTYYQVMDQEIFFDSNIWCKHFKLEVECRYWYKWDHLDPQWKRDAVDRYFLSKNNGQDPKNLDYSDFFKFLRERWPFDYYCSNVEELMSDERKLPTCPSILRYDFPAGVKNCPTRNLKFSNAENSSSCAITTIIAVAGDKGDLCKWISW